MNRESCVKRLKILNEITTMQIAVEDITIFADGLDHAECVAVHPDGSVWAGGEAGQIYRVSEDVKAITVVANTGGFI